jgi:EmrB/QacA subfamily drug resistance transporter
MSAQAPPVSRLPYRAVGSLVALGLAAFVVMIDSTVVQVMLPTLMGDLDAGLDEVLWVINGFTLVYGILLLPGARLGDVFGSRKLLVAGILIFLAGSVLGGVAQSVVMLVAGRLIQAIGGACLIPQTIGLITVVVPAHRRGLAFGFLSATMALAAILGPVLGGLLVSYVSWRSVFLANVPACLAAAALALRYLPSQSQRRSHQMDVLGAVLVIGSLGAVTYGFMAGNRYGWGTIAGPVSIPALFVVGLLLFVGFLWWEKGRPEPLVSFELFRFRSFSLAAWLGILQFALMFGLMLIVTLNVQTQLGDSAFHTGLVYLPMALLAGVASPLAGVCTDRWGGRFVITMGFLAIGVGIAWMAWVASTAATATSLVGPLAFAGLGVGLVMPPVNTEAMSQLPPTLVNTGSGIMNASRQVASALGVAMVGAVLQTGLSGSQPAPEGRAAFVTAERAALAVLAVFVLVAVVSAQFLPRPRQSAAAVVPDPAATTGPAAEPAVRPATEPVTGQ